MEMPGVPEMVARAMVPLEPELLELEPLELEPLELEPLELELPELELLELELPELLEPLELDPPLELVEVVVDSSADAEFVVTPSPPPHAASAQEMSKKAQAALISLKVKSTLLPAAADRGEQNLKKSPGGTGKRTRVPGKN